MSSIDLIIFPLTFSLSPSWCLSANDFEIFRPPRLECQWSFWAHCSPCTLHFSVSRSCCLLFQNFPQLWFCHNPLSSSCFSSCLKYLLTLEQHIGGFTTILLSHHLNCLFATLPVYNPQWLPIVHRRVSPRMVWEGSASEFPGMVPRAPPLG